MSHFEKSAVLTAKLIAARAEFDRMCAKYPVDEDFEPTVPVGNDYWGASRAYARAEDEYLRHTGQM